MQRPIDNPLGYNTSSVLSRVASFDTQYMLIHGTGDDNVHFQNGAVIANALVQNGANLLLCFPRSRAAHLCCCRCPDPAAVPLFSVAAGCYRCRHPVQHDVLPEPRPLADGPPPGAQPAPVQNADQPPPAHPRHQLTRLSVLMIMVVWCMRMSKCNCIYLATLRTNRVATCANSSICAAVSTCAVMNSKQLATYSTCEGHEEPND